MRRNFSLVAMALFALTVVACAGDEAIDSGEPAGGGSTGVTTSAMGPGLTVSAAIASGLDGPLLVNGYVLVDGAVARLCEALATSTPPRCEGASLEVAGLDRATLKDTRTVGGVTWTEQPTQLLGVVKGGRITLGPGVIG